MVGTLSTLLIFLVTLPPVRPRCPDPPRILALNLVNPFDSDSPAPSFARLDNLLPVSYDLTQPSLCPSPVCPTVCPSSARPSVVASGGASSTHDFSDTAAVPRSSGAPRAVEASPDTTGSLPETLRPNFPFNAFLPVQPLPPPPPKVQWAALFGSSLRYLALMHSYRVMTEAGTRYSLKHDAFWGGYLAALGAMHGWSDGDGYYENYLGHPIQGAVSGYIWLHNDPRYRRVQFGKDPNYWKSRLRAYAFAWAFSEQFEVGPVSEASIGQIQRYCCAFGFVDHVITPNGGMIWLVGEDAIDRYVVRKIEDHTRNQWIRIPARIAFNPLLSFANVMNLEYPWHRENRLDPDRYEPGSFVPEQTTATEKNSFVPSFEITATVPSFLNIGGLSCLGGGAVAGFRLSDNWQWTAEVGGCTLGNSLPKDWSGDSLTFTTGPQWIRHTKGRWSPHVHLRFGGQKITELHMNQLERQLVEQLVPPGVKLSNYYNLFTTSYESTGPSVTIGGGLDYRLSAAIALRVGGVEYVHSWLDPVHGANFNNGARFTTGMILRLGTW